MQNVVLMCEVLQASLKLLSSDFLISANAVKFAMPSIISPVKIVFLIKSSRPMSQTFVGVIGLQQFVQLAMKFSPADHFDTKQLLRAPKEMPKAKKGNVLLQPKQTAFS